MSESITERALKEAEELGGMCEIRPLNGAYVQENGIIRLGDGRYLGRLDGVTFEEVVERSTAQMKADEQSRDGVGDCE